MIRLREIADDFRNRYGRAPRLFRAPGRVNLIGEHTDYNEGFVMPAALEFATWTAAAPRDDRILRVHSGLRGEARTMDLDAPTPGGGTDWSDYVFGVAIMLERAGLRLSGCDLTLTSDVPIGAGLSSSAALEVSVGHALATLAGHAPDRVTLARICQRAENEHVGMRCGIMDQYIAARGVAGHALMIDCRTFEARPVALAPDARIVVANSMVHHELAGSNQYNLRRQSCEEGVRLLAPALGAITALRDVDAVALDAHRDLLPTETFRRCRHIVTENARVLEAVAAAEAGDMARFGALMDASHVSMRDDFTISCAEVDVLVALARALPGVWGSRMTGGGFGGCTVSLVAAEAVEAFVPALRAAYLAATGLEADIFACSPGGGVDEVDLDGEGRA